MSCSPEKVLSRILLLAAIVLAAPAAASPPKIPLPHLYLTPTVGVWRWDEKAFFPGTVENRTRPVYGVRVGYARFEALSAEVVVLSGTNRVVSSSNTVGGDELRLTQVELSMVVNFRSLINSRIYPFVNLGLGGSFPSGDVLVDGDPVLGTNKVNYHLGGGLKGDLNSRFTARLTFRDTFFNDSREVSKQTFQNTLDSVEISFGLDCRIPLKSGGGKGGGRLR